MSDSSTPISNSTKDFSNGEIPKQENNNKKNFHRMINKTNAAYTNIE